MRQPQLKRTGRTDLDASPTLPFNGGQLRDALKARIAMPTSPPLVPTRDSMPPPMIMAEEPPPMEPVYELRKPKVRRPAVARSGARGRSPVTHPPVRHPPLSHPPRARSSAAVERPVVKMADLPLVHTGVAREQPMAESTARPVAERAAQSEHRTTLLMLAGIVALLVGLMVILQ